MRKNLVLDDDVGISRRDVLLLEQLLLCEFHTANTEDAAMTKLCDEWTSRSEGVTTTRDIRLEPNEKWRATT